MIDWQGSDLSLRSYRVIYIYMYKINVLIYIQTEIMNWITLKSFKSLCLKSSQVPSH